MLLQADVPTFPSSHIFLGHVRKGRAIFGVHSGNPKFLLDIPAPGDAPSPRWDMLDGKFDRTAWVSPTAACCLFVPRDNPFHGPLFRRLALPLHLAICEGGGWMLTPEYVRSWVELESTLRRVLRAMNDVGKRVAVLPGMALYPWPLQYGYDIARSTRQSANSVAMRARNAFLPLMATISLWFVLLDDRYDSSWRDAVVESSGVHPQWFADLETSAVGDMTTPRVGGILDFTHQGDPVLTKKHDLEWLLPLVLGKLPLPLYFHWGDITHDPTFPIPEVLQWLGLRPDVTEITYLLDLPGEVAFSPWEKGRGQGKMYPRRARHPFLPAAVADAGVVNAQADASTHPEPDGPEVISKFPQPEKDSGQLHGENFHAFLTRRKARNEQLAKRETSQMTQKRLKREAHAAQGGPPGKKGPRVFIWEDENGFFIRRTINRSFAADRWNEFTHNQRLYDGYHNQWDLCSALAPDEEPDDDSDRGSAEMPLPDADFPNFPGVPDTLEVEQEPCDTDTAVDLTHSYDLQGLEPGEIIDDSEPVYEPYHDMSEIPHTRFGFIKPIDRPPYPKRLENRLSLKSLGDEKWPSLGNTAYEHLPSLLAYLADATSISDIPNDLLDLRQVDADISLESNWVIDVSREKLNGKLFYILRPKDSASEDCPVHLLLSSAATTLQVVRMGWGPDPQEIIFHLLRLGVEFRICIRDHVYDQPQPQLPHAHAPLGYRRKGYKPTVVDHGVYMMLRDRFLASPRGRAARLAGGIIGRLAFDVADDTLASVGPGSEVFMTGIRLWDGSSSAAYWDDTLTDQEIDLVCGVYEIATGRVNKSTEDPQLSKLSWWPKPYAFSASGLNTGWWSPDCERWFLQRQAVINSDRATLHTQTEWKSKIRYYKQPREIGMANDRIAAQFLSTKLSR